MSPNLNFKALLPLMGHFVCILLVMILPSEGLVPTEEGNPHHQSTTPQTTPYLVSIKNLTCPSSCSCLSQINNSFSIECEKQMKTSMDQFILLDMSNITTLHIVRTAVSIIELFLDHFDNLSHLEWKDSSLKELPFDILSCNKSLRLLDLSGNNITTIISKGHSLSYFPLLTTLIVKDNNISQFSLPSLGKEPSLNITQLDVSTNTIEYIHTESFHAVPFLTFLNLSNNNIDSIQGSLSLLDILPKLEVLDISHNSLLTLTGLTVSKKTTLRKLNASHNLLMSLFSGTFFKMSHLEELDLRHNRLVFISAGVFPPNMRKLRRLYLSYNRLVAFGGGALHGLSGLHTLHLDHNQLTQIEASYFTRSMPDTSPGWEASSSGKALDLSTINSNQTKVWIHLHSLDLSHNNISDIAPSIFHTTLALVHHIDLSFNRIICLPRYGVETLTDLESINVSHNHLQWLDIGTFKNTRLRSINLSHNHLVKVICMAFLYLPSIEKVDLSYNQLDYIYKYAFYKTCAYDQNLSIYLQHNELNSDALWKVMSSFRHLEGGSCTVSIHLQNNSISYILGSAIDTYQKHLLLEDYNYFSIWDHIKVHVGNNEVTCDCDMYREIMMLEAVKKTFQKNYTRPDHLSFWHDLVCHSPARLSQRRVAEVIELMQCPLTKNCPEKCSCILQPPLNLIQVDCQGRNLSQFPNVLPSGRKEIYLNANNLVDLQGHINLDDVISIDLTYNKLRFIDKRAWESLLTVPYLLLSDNLLETLPWSDQNLSSTLNITLSNNSFQCTCENFLFKDWIMEHFDKIYDIFNVTCSNGLLNGLPVLDVSDEDFECYPKGYNQTRVISIPIFASIITCSFLLIIILASILYRYRLYIKLFCVQLWPWQQFVNDPGKTDIFVCYSLADSKWVNRQLVPRLLSHFPPYSVILQHKDTKPGALLTESLVDSIESSETIMLILSKDFFRSDLMMSEDYRYIIHQMIQDDSNNIYVIFLDDAVFEDIEADNIECLRTHHCFSVKEDWFWERLFHMLPPPQSSNREPDEEVKKAEMQICAKY